MHDKSVFVSAWKIVLAGKPLGLTEKWRDEAATAEKTGCAVSPAVEENDVNATEHTESSINKAQEETMGAISSSSLPFVFNSVMQTYMASPDGSPINSRPGSNPSVINEMDDGEFKGNLDDAKDDTTTSVVGMSSIEEISSVGAEKEIAENAVHHVNTDNVQKVVDFAPLPDSEKSLT